MHVRVGDSAHVAQFLGQDEVGAQLAQQVFVEGVDGAVIVDAAGHQAIDRSAVTGGVECGRGDHRLGPSDRRVVALMGHRDEVVGEPKRAHDLGGAGQ